MKFLQATLLLLSVTTMAAFPNPRIEDTNITMSDKTLLNTAIHFPLQRSKSGKYPIIIDRSPYGYSDMEWITDIFLPFGYVAVGQDLRGTEKSEGDFSLFQSDALDSRDTGDWLVSQDWSNGEIYSFGMSADGLANIQMSFTNPDWLKGQYIGWAPSQMYNILFPHGCYKQKLAEDWFNDLTMTNEKMHPITIQTVHDNEAHTPFWKNVEMNDEKFGNIKHPSSFWAGWFDVFATETLALYKGTNELSDPSVRHTSKLTIDPCGHCLEAQDFWTENIVEGRTGVMLAQIFEVFNVDAMEHHRIHAIKNITFYVMSSNDDAGKEAGQYWTSIEEWPKIKGTDYYFNSDGSATTTKANTESDSTSYVYDPTNPVPTIGGNNLPPSIGGTIACGPLDQNELDGRTDILNFDMDAVTGEPLYLTGAITAKLFVGSDAIDTDFHVKISDVYPTGEVRIIIDNGFRMKWRSAGQVPDAHMKNNTVYEIDVNVWETSYAVGIGHKLRFSISSSNFPRFNVNHNNGLLLNDVNYPGEFITATNTLHHSLRYPSKISLPVVRKHEIPEVRVLEAVQEAYPEITQEMIQKVGKSITENMKRR